MKNALLRGGTGVTREKKAATASRVTVVTSGPAIWKVSSQTLKGDTELICAERRAACSDRQKCDSCHDGRARLAWRETVDWSMEGGLCAESASLETRTAGRKSHSCCRCAEQGWTRTAYSR